MRRKSKVTASVLKVLLAAVLVVAAIASAFLISARRFVFVMDDATALVLPRAELARMRIALAARWSHLVVVRPQADVLDDPFLLNDFVQSVGERYRVRAVLFCQVVSSMIAEYDVDAGSFIPNAAVYGIGGVEGENGLALADHVDSVLVPDIRSGWTSAATSISHDALSMSRNVAVVSDSYGSAYNQAISACFPSGMLSIYTNDDGSRLFSTSTVKEMNRLGIAVAMCPHLDEFYAVFDADDTISWVVDYRYSAVVPKGQLYGTVLPDLSGFVATASLSKDGALESGSGAGAGLAFKYDGR